MFDLEEVNFAAAGLPEPYKSQLLSVQNEQQARQVLDSMPADLDIDAGVSATFMGIDDYVHPSNQEEYEQQRKERQEYNQQQQQLRMNEDAPIVARISAWTDALTEQLKPGAPREVEQAYRAIQSYTSDGMGITPGQKQVLQRLATEPASVTDIVYRGMELPEDFLQEGQTLDLGDMSSWSANPEVSMSFTRQETEQERRLRKEQGGERNTEKVLLRMKPRVGVDISLVSEFPDEEEFLTSGSVRIDSVNYDEQLGALVADVTHLADKKAEFDLQQWANDVQQRYGLDKFIVTQRGDTLRLDAIVVPRDKQGQGIGTQVMQELNAMADANGWRVALTPESPGKDTGTTSKKRLQQFYKDKGYVMNKGKNKDYEISDLMYREPKQGGVRLVASFKNVGATTPTWQKLESLVDQGYYFSMADTPKFGGNPQTPNYTNTPYGFYGYPLDSNHLQQLKASTNAHSGLPFAGTRQYILVFQPAGNVLDVSGNDLDPEPYWEEFEEETLVADALRDIEKLRDKAEAVYDDGQCDFCWDQATDTLSMLEDWARDEDQEIPLDRINGVSFPEEVGYDEDEQPYPTDEERAGWEEWNDMLHNFTQNYTSEEDPDTLTTLIDVHNTQLASLENLPPNGQVYKLIALQTQKQPAAMTKALKAAGFDVVRDPGTGTVHPNEPDQVVVLNPSAIREVATLENPMSQTHEWDDTQRTNPIQERSQAIERMQQGAPVDALGLLMAHYWGSDHNKMEQLVQQLTPEQLQQAAQHPEELVRDEVRRQMQKTGQLKWLTPAVMGLGMGMATPDMAEAAPKQQPQQQQQHPALQKMQQLRQSVAGDKKLEQLFMKGYRAFAKTPGDYKHAHQEHGPASKEADAFRKGVQYGKAKVEHLTTTYKSGAVNVVDESPESHDRPFKPEPGLMEDYNMTAPQGEPVQDPHGAGPWSSERTIEGDKMPGGLGDDMPDSAFDAKQLELGIKEELEHTTDKELAKEIAKDHLAEDPQFYAKQGTVKLAKTVYHATTPEAAEQIVETGVLRSAGEPDVYVTVPLEGAQQSGYGNTIIALDVPDDMLELDDEFPDGREDYRLPAPGMKLNVSRFNPRIVSGHDQHGERGFNLVDLTERETPVPHRMSPYKDLTSQPDLGPAVTRQAQIATDRFQEYLNRNHEFQQHLKLQSDSLAYELSQGLTSPEELVADLRSAIEHHAHEYIQEMTEHLQAHLDERMFTQLAQAYAKDLMQRLPKQARKPTVAIDLDQTILEKADESEFLPSGQPAFGAPRDGVHGALETLHELGWYIIVHSARFSEVANRERAEAELDQYLTVNQIPFDQIWHKEGKPRADAYIDDKAIPYEGDWYETIKRVTMHTSESRTQTDHTGVALIDSGYNENDWTNADETRLDRSIPRPHDTEKLIYGH